MNRCQLHLIDIYESVMPSCPSLDPSTGYTFDDRLVAVFATSSPPIMRIDPLTPAIRSQPEQSLENDESVIQQL